MQFSEGKKKKNTGRAKSRVTLQTAAAIVGAAARGRGPERGRGPTGRAFRGKGTGRAAAGARGRGAHWLLFGDQQPATGEQAPDEADVLQSTQQPPEV